MAEALVKIIRDTPENICHLDLANNHLNDAGVSQLVRLFAHSKSAFDANYLKTESSEPGSRRLNLSTISGMATLETHGRVTFKIL